MTSSDSSPNPTHASLGPNDQEAPSSHYMMAHYSLRQFGLEQPARFLNIVASNETERFLADVLAITIDKLGAKPGLRAEDIKCERTRVGNHPCILLVFPPPTEFTEAYMTALVVLIDVTKDQAVQPEDIQARYFTLEKSFAVDAIPRTIFGEWQDEKHLNYGIGPEPAPLFFVERIAQHLGLA